jgi:hypothetical protein
MTVMKIGTYVYRATWGHLNDVPSSVIPTLQARTFYYVTWLCYAWKCNVLFASDIQIAVEEKYQISYSQNFLFFI